MKIRKNGNILNVSKGAFAALFAPMGYKPVEAGDESFIKEAPQKSENFVVDDVPFGNILNPEIDDNEGSDDENYEVVLSEMTVAELVEYADEQDIDIEGLKKKHDIIERIEAVME